MRFVNLLQPLLDNVGVDLRCRNIRVAKHQLNGSQIRAALEQVCGETMPQHVRGQRHSQFRPAPVRGENFPDAYAAQLPPPPVEEQRRTARRLADELRPRVTKILFHHAERLASHGNNALFVTFADATHTTDFGVEIRDAQSNEFRDPQAVEYRTSS